MKSWYVINTKRFKEVQAAVWISHELRFETACPMITVRKTSKGRRTEFAEPMFRNYIFARFDEKLDRMRWPVISHERHRYTKRVMCDVQGNPIPLRDDVVEELRRRDGEMDSKILALKNLKSGDKVRIEQGPFAGFEAVFSQRDGDAMITLLLDIFGRKVTTSVSDLAISAA